MPICDICFQENVVWAMQYPYHLPICMMDIFHDMVDDFVEILIDDDFSVFGESFDKCLENLDRVLARCEETNLV